MSFYKQYSVGDKIHNDAVCLHKSYADGDRLLRSNDPMEGRKLHRCRLATKTNPDEVFFNNDEETCPICYSMFENEFVIPIANGNQSCIHKIHEDCLIKNIRSDEKKRQKQCCQCKASFTKYRIHLNPNSLQVGNNDMESNSCAHCG